MTPEGLTRTTKAQAKGNPRIEMVAHWNLQLADDERSLACSALLIAVGALEAPAHFTQLLPRSMTAALAQND